MIIDFKLLMACMGLGALYLIIVTLLWNRLERVVPIFENFPKGLIEESNPAGIIYTFVVELIFYIFIPAMVYAWFYTLIPFSGIRGGLSVALMIYVLGAVPISISILFKVKLPVVYLLYQSLGMLIKLAGTLAIIGYLYAL